MRRFWGIVGTSIVIGMGAHAAFAGPVEDALAKATLEAEAGRCEEAVRRIEAIDGLGSRAHLVGGQCQIGQGRYAEALAAFERADRAGDLSERQMGDLELHRGIALFHLERFGEAEKALDSADGLTRDDAQLSLYRGMIALRRNDNDRAAPALESAARLNPGLTEPVASYYAGLAWKGSAERTKARDAFQRVIELDPDGPWGKQAANLLETTELLPFFARASVGVEYDDNVFLRAQGIDRRNTDREKDWRGVWSAEAGVQLFQDGPWSGGVLGSYSGNKHHRTGDFDVHFPSIGAYLEHRYGPDTIGRVRYDFGHAWIDKGSFLKTHSVQGALVHTWERVGTTEVSADLTWNDLGTTIPMLRLVLRSKRTSSVRGALMEVLRADRSV